MGTETDGNIVEIPIVTETDQEDFEKSLAADEAALEASLSKSGAQAPAPKDEAITETEPKAGTQEPSKEEKQKAEAEAAEKAAQAKEPTKWEKAKAREAEAWKKIEAEKAELKAERERIASERQQHQPKQQDRIDAKTAELAIYKREARVNQLKAEKTERELTEAEQEEMAAAKYELKQLRAIHAEAVQEESKAAQTEQRKQQSVAQQNESWQRARTEFPEALEKGTPLNIALVDFIGKNEDFIATVPNGPYAATMFVKAQLEASRVPVLEQEKTALTEKNAQLQKRVDELTAATSLNGGGNGGLSRPGATRNFNEMSTKDMEAQLDREFAAQ